MDYDYALTTSYDGELVHTLRTTDTLEAVNAWNKIRDCGDAQEIHNLQFITVRQNVYANPLSQRRC
jgi:hypothetical protein